MSLRWRGYSPDGTRRIVDDGPAHGRIAGVRGSALGHDYVVTAVKQAQHRRIAAPDERRTRYTDVPRCGAPVRQGWRSDLYPGEAVGEPCARTLGHNEGHSTRETLDRENAQRRGR